MSFKPLENMNVLFSRFWTSLFSPFNQACSKVVMSVCEPQWGSGEMGRVGLKKNRFFQLQKLR